MKTAIGFLLLVFLATACTKSDDPSESDSLSNIERITLDEPEIFVDFGELLKGVPWAIELLESGNLAVLDNQLNEILIFDKDGQLLRTIGSEGQGPGEFERARMLDQCGETIGVTDFSQKKVTMFNELGEIGNIYSFSTGMLFDIFHASLCQEAYYTAANGEEGALIIKTDFRNEAVSYIGQTDADPLMVGNLDEYNRTLSRGEIPSIFYHILTMQSDDRYLYVFHNSLSKLQKYNQDGDLQWEKSINMPENREIFAQVVERAGNNQSPAGVPSLSYIISMHIANGNIFLNWTRPEDDGPALLVKMNSEGEAISVYEIPIPDTPFRNMAVDYTNGQIYLSSPGSAIIYRTRIDL